MVFNVLGSGRLLSVGFPWSWLATSHPPALLLRCQAAGSQQLRALSQVGPAHAWGCPPQSPGETSSGRPFHILPFNGDRTTPKCSFLG